MYAVSQGLLWGMLLTNISLCASILLYSSFMTLFPHGVRVNKLRGGMLLGAFAKLWKATFGLFMSVCMSVRIEQLASHWADFYEIRCMNIYRKYVEKIHVSLKSDKDNRLFTWRHNIYMYDNISLNSS
jgi:hypothetical protein